MLYFGSIRGRQRYRNSTASRCTSFQGTEVSPTLRHLESTRIRAPAPGNIVDQAVFSFSRQLQTWANPSAKPNASPITAMKSDWIQKCGSEIAVIVHTTSTKRQIGRASCRER